MLAPKLKSPERPGLVLLAPAITERTAQGDPAARVRLRLRKWESRRTWAGRALIALSFPMAYLLIMLATGTPAPVVAVRIVIWMWVAALAVAIVCAEAAWRNASQLDRLASAEPARPRH